MDKDEQMRNLRTEAANLACRICPPGARIVWGKGPLDARLVLVGEAPGAEEEREGRPFAGPAGRFLDRELAAAGISRGDVYIANAVKCWMVRIRNGRASNRAPTTREVVAWSAILAREIETVGPKVILCLGAIAARAVLGPGFEVARDRGKWLPGPAASQVLVTFHPSYVRRFGASHNALLTAFRRDLARACSFLRDSSSEPAQD